MSKSLTGSGRTVKGGNWTLKTTDGVDPRRRAEILLTEDERRRAAAYVTKTVGDCPILDMLDLRGVTA